MRARTYRAGALGAPAFTLVELLVVIGIIALLISILLPALGKAREASNTIKSASNLRSVGQGMAMYVAEFRQTYPAAYLYVGQSVRQGDGGGNDDSQGYIHWSSFLYGNKAGANDDVGIFRSLAGWDVFACPNIEQGGLPPTNTFAGNLDAGQQSDAGGSVIDHQSPRCAYTVNEAICPRNKFYIGFQGAVRPYQFVRAGAIRNASETILATEWNQDWHIVSAAARVDPNATVCKSHRPVHGFKGVSGGLDMEQIPPQRLQQRPQDPPHPRRRARPRPRDRRRRHPPGLGRPQPRQAHPHGLRRPQDQLPLLRRARGDQADPRHPRAPLRMGRQLLQPQPRQ